jgi:hypothetical protein
MMDCHDTLYPDRQLVMEVDHSQGHAKLRQDGLHASHMRMKIGGKQLIPRVGVGSRITKGCLEPSGYVRGAHVLKSEGMWQHFEFRAGDHVNPGEEDKYPEAPVGKAKGLRQILWERGLWGTEVGRCRLTLSNPS